MSDTKSPDTHRVLDVAELVLWPALLIFGSLVAWEIFEQGKEAGWPPGVFSAPSHIVDAEDLHLATLSRSFQVRLQPTSNFSRGRWSGDRHMFVVGMRKGDWLELELPVSDPGRYGLELFLTRSHDYGIVVVSLNGEPAGGEVDLWSGEGVVPSGPIDLGLVELGEAPNVLRITVVGTNSHSTAPFYQFGIDGVRLTPAAEARPDAEEVSGQR